MRYNKSKIVHAQLWSFDPHTITYCRMAVHSRPYPLPSYRLHSMRASFVNVGKSSIFHFKCIKDIQIIMMKMKIMSKYFRFAIKFVEVVCAPLEQLLVVMGVIGMGVH